MLQIIFLLFCIFAIIYIIILTNYIDFYLKETHEKLNIISPMTIEPLKTISKKKIFYKNNKNKNKLRYHKGKK